MAGYNPNIAQLVVRRLTDVMGVVAGKIKFNMQE